MHAFAQLRGELIDLVIAVDFNGLARSVDDNFAMTALAQMRTHLLNQFRFDLPIEVVGHLAEKVCASHYAVISFFCRKYRLNRSRNCRRARSNLDFTAGTLNPSASAVSSVDKFSMSRRVKTVLNPGGKP